MQIKQFQIICKINKQIKNIQARENVFIIIFNFIFDLFVYFRNNLELFYYYNIYLPFIYVRKREAIIKANHFKSIK